MGTPGEEAGRWWGAWKSGLFDTPMTGSNNRLPLPADSMIAQPGLDPLWAPSQLPGLQTVIEKRYRIGNRGSPFIVNGVLRYLLTKFFQNVFRGIAGFHIGQAVFQALASIRVHRTFSDSHLDRLFLKIVPTQPSIIL
jgi:hypothetical protein